MKTTLILFFVSFLSTSTCVADSAYPLRLEDASAVYLVPGRFHVRGDGVADDSAAVQAAIDEVQATKGEGIVFIPQGRYSITRTIYLWPGIRIIGYGTQRPVFVLGDRTPGYQAGIAYMFFFAGAKPGDGEKSRRPESLHVRTPPTQPGVVPPSLTVPDANPGTFYSAMSNVDFEVGADNAGAVAIRFHAAQHAYLSHMDFNMGSGFAGVHEVANIAEDLHFHGGQFGIMARKPSPAWQFTLVDSSFDGQREAAIRENEAGLTLVHDEFHNVPTAISIDSHYSDQLWIKDSFFDNISGPAVLISDETSRMTEINFEDVVCRHVPVFAKFRESGRQFLQPADIYHVGVFSHGLGLTSIGALADIKTRFDASPIRSFPATSAPAGIPRPWYSQAFVANSCWRIQRNHRDRNFYRRPQQSCCRPPLALGTSLARR
ncbi:glycoside hydrolase family 55 protein [Granulicella sp. WH15]|uniref:glycoside hydrolase family 55 protein n=1 Tax=Granulicella sp. WH15 TaxID=2602070 RepID=UPI001C6FF451|nr:glycoside hydrolase family 55 protein [Granulicella sp. WH15]